MAGQEPQQEHPGGDQVDRRGFLKAAAGIVGGIISLVLAVPLVSTLVAPIYRRQRGRFAQVGRIASLPQEQPVNVSFEYETEDAYVRRREVHDVWVIRHSPTELTVLSPICTHLGCRFDWDAAAGQFRCPCHGSVFSITGKVLAGPAPRPLDTLPFKVEKGELLVEWERFKPGISRKVLV